MRKDIFILIILFIMISILYLYRRETSNHLEKVLKMTKSRFMKALNADDGNRNTTTTTTTIGLEETISIHNNDKNNLKGYKNIAFWTGYSGKLQNWLSVFKRLVNKECEENRCNLIFNQSEIAMADAVVFNAVDLRKKSQFHSKTGSKMKILYPDYPRREDQIFVLYTNEPPTYIQHIQFGNYDNFFNWTMTYRKDSDIFVPYGMFSKRETKRREEEVGYVTEDELKAKNMAVWMVSHCRTPSKRSDFVGKLKRFVSVDTYGNCGSKKCGKRTIFSNVEDEVESDPCFDLIKNYTFYLALENSLCTDYVTEKLYRSLKIGIVPIVLGAVDYSEIAPPNSYIDVKDFDNFDHFVNHVKKVASDAQLYNEYLQWREDYDIEVGTPYKPLICDLCKKLHDQTPNSPRKTYGSIKDWVNKDGQCQDLETTLGFY